eukprot:TRINITY_DN1180_c0_g1_i1.p1 TRINITY_DN1180_c0_g1~~TRINITY_DN1180_c0_g1_i1.p1  ORF type:complete len:413 (+),score=107.00 TRINITY_DN1180_c0_g1_i1:74-1312(+)
MLEDGKYKFATTAVHTHDTDPLSGAVVPTITLSSTFVNVEPGIPKAHFEYARHRNPTRDVFQQSVAKLENAKYGLAFGSGLACNTTILHMFKAGDHAVCMDDVYGGTYRYFARVVPAFNIDVSFVDFTVDGAVEAAIRPETKFLWLETPSNPLLKIVDIKKYADIAHAHGALLIVDNTFMSPYFQSPLELGADIVVHSVTKYINGHCDVVMGALATNNTELYERLQFLQNAVGGVPSAFDCYLAIRGLKTLHLRMREHDRNARLIADFLATDPHLEKVIYPGLASHPQHELAKTQMRGFGGMISFYLKGGMPAVKLFCSKLKLFALAVSLGGVESLINHPATMTHASVAESHRISIGVTDNLLRISVGIEDAEDLIADLKQAFAALDEPIDEEAAAKIALEARDAHSEAAHE